METKYDQYLLIFREESASAAYRTMSSEQRQRLLQQWTDWYDGLTAQGKLQGGNPLDPGGRIVSYAGGRIVDGPFTEAKEAIGGYFLLTAADLDEATEIAKQCPSLMLGLTVEVRPVAGHCSRLGFDKGVEQELVNT